MFLQPHRLLGNSAARSKRASVPNGRDQLAERHSTVMNYTMRVAGMFPTQRRQLWQSSGVNFLKRREKQ
jgi:hypothetical protein